MTVLHAVAEENAVMVKIQAAAQTEGNVVHVRTVVVADCGVEHYVIPQKEAGISLNAEAQLLLRAIGQPHVGNRGTEILGASLKLSLACNKSHEQQRRQNDFLHVITKV